MEYTFAYENESQRTFATTATTTTKKSTTEMRRAGEMAEKFVSLMGGQSKVGCATGQSNIQK